VEDVLVRTQAQSGQGTEIQGHSSHLLTQAIQGCFPCAQKLLAVFTKEKKKKITPSNIGYCRTLHIFVLTIIIFFFFEGVGGLGVVYYFG
jgi:hypothetical protein